MFKALLAHKLALVALAVVVPGGAVAAGVIVYRRRKAATLAATQSAAAQLAQNEARADVASAPGAIPGIEYKAQGTGGAPVHGGGRIDAGLNASDDALTLSPLQQRVAANLAKQAAARAAAEQAARNAAAGVLAKGIPVTVPTGPGAVMVAAPAPGPVVSAHLSLAPSIPVTHFTPQPKPSGKGS